MRAGGRSTANVRGRLEGVEDGLLDDLHGLLEQAEDAIFAQSSEEIAAKFHNRDEGEDVPERGG